MEEKGISQRNFFKKDEFLAVLHRYLNAVPNIEACHDEVYKLRHFTNGRTPVPALEGDLREDKHTGNLFFTHKKYNPDRIQTLKELGLAASCEYTLDHIADNGRNTHLIIELKPGLSQKGMENIVKLLKDRDIDNFVFDSFFPELLKLAQSEYPGCITSHHLGAYVNGIELKLWMPNFDPTIKTIPYIFTAGDPKMPMIYGAVNSIDKFARVADKPNVVGAYARFNDSSFGKLVSKTFSP